MTTAMQKFEAERAVRAQAQAKVNALFGAVGEDAAHAEIVRLATEEHAGFSQYDGYWDGPEWILGKASVKIAGKGGVLAEAEDVILICRDYADGFKFFSVRTGWNCGVNHGLVPLMGWAAAFALWSAQSDERRATAHNAYVTDILARLEHPAGRRRCVRRQTRPLRVAVSPLGDGLDWRCHDRTPLRPRRALQP